jgi:hypothetical protein
VSGENRRKRWAKGRQKAGNEQLAVRILGKELWVQHFNDRGHMVSSSFAFAWSRAWKD